MARKKKQKTIVEKLLNKEPINQINIFLQGIILVLLLLFIIMSIFVKEFSGAVKMLVALLLLLMAYNNVTIFKRKWFTIIYSIFGLYFMAMAVLEAYGS